MSDTGRLFAALADDVRRRLLFRLCEVDTIEVPKGAMPNEPDCSGAVTERGMRGSDRGSSDDSSTPRSLTDGGCTSTSLEIELYHTHLPKLRDDGFIRWEQGSGYVSRGPRFERIEPALRMIRSNAEAFPDDL